MKTTLRMLVLAVSSLTFAACTQQESSNVPTTAGEPSPNDVKPEDLQASSTTATGRVEVPVSPTGSEPYLMASSNSVSGSFGSPSAGTVSGFAVQIGNFGGTADGQLSVKLCSATTQQCIEATANLAGSVDNDFLPVPLAQPIKVSTGEVMSYTLTRASGEKPFAIWTYPALNGEEMTLADGSKAPRGPRVALDYSGN